MEIERVLFELFVMFAAAKIAGEIFERVGQPPVIGELLVGVALGPHALGLISDTEVHHVLQELGAIVLLFMVGLDTRLGELRAVGARALGVGAAGIVLPFALGGAYVYLVAGSPEEAAFMGAAMVATSVGITARVLSDLGVVHAVESRVVLGAAVVDDVLGLLVLAFVSGATQGDLSVVGIVALALGAILFVVLVGGLGPRAVEKAAPTIEKAVTKRGPLVVALAILLGLSALAGAVGLAAIIGAFLAGMAFSEMRPRWELERQVEPVYELLVPFFFVVTGSAVELGTFTEPSTVLAVVVVTLIAIVGKLAGCGGAAWGMGRRSAAIVGVGMVPRGEVGIIVASVGLSSGLIEAELYGVIVAMSILTTLVTPPALKALFRAHPTRRARDERTDEIEGIGG
ncbi:MAG TPA: cation:proton antiporter [Actinomycetota bacterium]|nr:cation:proton antiporter [Actinomycetota bacterium]